MRQKDLPSQQDQESLQPPRASIHIVAVEHVEPVLRREAGMLQQEDQVVELAVDVTDDDDGAAAAGIDSDDIGLLADDVGGCEEKALEKGERESGGELGGWEVPRRPVEGGGEAPDPFEAQGSVWGPREVELGSWGCWVLH